MVYLKRISKEFLCGFIFIEFLLFYGRFVGINWLACHVGRLICFDNSTEKLQRFKYAKALVEISPDFELPESISIPGLGENCPDVKLSYDWRPKICTLCKIFGHDTVRCESVNKTKENDVKKVVNSVENGDKNQSDHGFTNNNITDQSWKNVERRNKGVWKKKEIVAKEKVQLSVDPKIGMEIGKGKSSEGSNVNSTYSFSTVTLNPLLIQPMITLI